MMDTEQFYPTPKELLEKIFKDTDWRTVSSILEPSAGNGDICDYIMDSAKEERWVPMEIKGVHGYFCDLRIDRGTVPNSFDFWEVADGDSDGMPCRYKFGILVNFFGTFITTGRLPVDDMEYGEGFINSGDEWGFLDGSYSFSEIEKMEGVG